MGRSAPCCSAFADDQHRRRVSLAHVHADFYEKAKKYVENGGFLYASVATDGAIPEMASLFGARLVERSRSQKSR